MHIPLDDVYVCWRQLATGVTNVCRFSLSLSLICDYIRRKISLGGKALVWWRSEKGVVGMIGIGGEEGKAKEGRRQKRVEFHRAMCLHRRRSRKNTAESLARARFFFALSLSRLLNQATRRGLKKDLATRVRGRWSHRGAEFQNSRTATPRWKRRGAVYSSMEETRGGGEDREENSLLRRVWWDVAVVDSSHAGKATKGKLYRFGQTDRAWQQPVQCAPTFSQDISLCSIYALAFHISNVLFCWKFTRIKILR